MIFYLHFDYRTERTEEPIQHAIIQTTQDKQHKDSTPEFTDKKKHFSCPY